MKLDKLLFVHSRIILLCIKLERIYLKWKEWDMYNRVTEQRLYHVYYLILYTIQYMQTYMYTDMLNTMKHAPTPQFIVVVIVNSGLYFTRCYRKWVSVNDDGHMTCACDQRVNCTHKNPPATYCKIQSDIVGNANTGRCWIENCNQFCGYR